MTVWTISKEFSFSASHRLTGLPPTHPCTKLHGHNYVVRLVLRSNVLSETGVVVDYNELKAFKEFIDTHLDHKDLNEVLQFNPTAENIAFFLYRQAKARWPQTYEVHVSETPKTNAVYREET